jgi:hypothetical protein
MNPIHIPYMRILNLIPHAHGARDAVLRRRVHEAFVGGDVGEFVFVGEL